MTREEATCREGPTTSCRRPSSRSTRTPSPSADTNGDDSLDTDELRKLLVQAADRPDDRRHALARGFRPGDRPGRKPAELLPKGTQVRRLADGDVEFAIGKVRLDIRVEDGNAAAEDVRRIVEQRFKAADANKDGYLEGKELAAINAPQSPLAGLSRSSTAMATARST